MVTVLVDTYGQYCPNCGQMMYISNLDAFGSEAQRLGCSMLGLGIIVPFTLLCIVVFVIVLYSLGATLFS